MSQRKKTQIKSAHSHSPKSVRSRFSPRKLNDWIWKLSNEAKKIKPSLQITLLIVQIIVGFTTIFSTMHSLKEKVKPITPETSKSQVSTAKSCYQYGKKTPMPFPKHQGGNDHSISKSHKE